MSWPKRTFGTSLLSPLLFSSPFSPGQKTTPIRLAPKLTRKGFLLPPLSKRSCTAKERVEPPTAKTDADREKANAALATSFSSSSPLSFLFFFSEIMENQREARG